MKKIYVIVDARSGEDYSTDDPTVLFVGENEEEALEFFNNEIASWEEDLEDFDSDCTDTDDYKVYECTDFEGDSHRVMKLVYKEVK